MSLFRAQFSSFAACARAFVSIHIIVSANTKSKCSTLPYSSSYFSFSYAFFSLCLFSPPRYCSISLRHLITTIYSFRDPSVCFACLSLHHRHFILCVCAPFSQCQQHISHNVYSIWILPLYLLATHAFASLGRYRMNAAAYCVARSRGAFNLTSTHTHTHTELFCTYSPFALIENKRWKCENVASENEKLKLA